MGLKFRISLICNIDCPFCFKNELDISFFPYEGIRYVVIRIHLKQIISMLITGSAVIVLQSKWKEFSCLVPQSIIIGFTTTHVLRIKVIV